MSVNTLRRKILGRRSVRARIALACAGLFLVTGGAFVAVTYTLVDHSLATTGAPKPAGVNKHFLQTCYSGKQNGTLTVAEVARCKQALATAADFGAAMERLKDLHELLLWSLVGLAVATIVAGLLGWAIGRRILVPLHKVTGAARRASQEHLHERIGLDGPQTSSRSSPTPSTTCWTASTSHSPASDGSWPTLLTNYGPRSLPCAPSSTWRWQSPPGPSKASRPS